MYIPRDAESRLQHFVSGYPVVVVTGPRQSGKSTLVRHAFPEHRYVSLEDLDQREFAESDPRGFLNQFTEGAILDEVQRCPALFSYLKTRVDELNRPGEFILTGSQQFGLLSGITQSLAGRAALLTLLPMTYGELQHAGKISGKLDNTYQLNFGGNMDFMNMLERERLMSKKISKTQSVTSQIERKINSESVHIGPSDHVPWLTDRKWAYIRVEGTSFGDVPLNAELKLEVWDSPNSAGVIIDAVRCAKIAMDRGLAGPLLAPSSYFMKSPSVQYHDSVAHDNVEAFIADNDNTVEDLAGFLTSQ